jgi:predicted kinase
MDLDLAGRCDLGDQLVRGYVARSGDATLQTVLRFYQCYRAYVRGKIALLITTEPEVPAQQRAVELATAAAAFDLARSYAAPGPRPLLIVMAGLSGSGKSTLARELARRLPAVVHASDQVRKEAAGVAPSVRLGEASYSAEPVARVYAELGRRASATLAQGLNTILDATFLSVHERDAAVRLGGDGRASVVVLECRCTDALARSRLQERQRLATDTSDADLRVYEAQRRQPPLEPGTEAAVWVAMDTDGSPPTLARAAMRRLWEPDAGLG